MKYLTRKNRFLRHLPAMPLITLAIFPIAVMDLYVELYHRISFPLYRIPLVNRRSYIRIDRHRLPYLNLLQKYYCVYCGYANGVVRYWVKIFSETERFWCGIRHEEKEGFRQQEHQEDFLPYGDEEGFKRAYLDHKTRPL